MSHKKVILLPMLVFILLLGASGVAQADPPVPGEVPPDGSSLNETLSFNNLGTIMSGRNDAGEADDGVDDQDPGNEVDDPDGDLKQHPVASALAEFFGVTYEKVMELHEAGNGFGTITKTYFFAEKLDMSPDQLLEKAHLEGWGNVLKEGGIHPGSVGNGGVNSNRPDHAGRPDKDGPPGQIKKDDDADGVSTGTSDLVGPGNNGNNGRSNGSGNSNNSGNGNNKGVNGQPDDIEGGPGNSGNNGNNGRGNGNGRGHGNK